MSTPRMSSGRKAIRQTLTIARRDFIATVFTPVFLLFLFAPLIAGSFSVLAGAGAAGAAGNSDKARIVVLAPAVHHAAIARADARLRSIFRQGEQPPALTTLAAAGDPAQQARAAFASNGVDTIAVLYGRLDRPTILYAPRGPRPADYLAALAQATLTDERLGADLPRVAPERIAFRAAGRSPRGGHQSGFFAVFAIFFLTLFLAGQVVGTMAEERNNKVIEVLAAAVPLESVFLGKLLGMFGVAVLFVAFWAGVVSQVGALMPVALRGGLADVSPATGIAFAPLFIGYFTMAYLLLGSVFLGIGAQATTPREIQMLSLPITIIQVAMFALASAAAARPGSTLALVAELFPLSSPFAMVGHAANQPGLWRHLTALAWQLLWVAIFIALGARLFRRGVLQSGSAAPWWKRRPTIESPSAKPG